MKQLKRLNLKSGTTLNSAEMKQILGGMVTTIQVGCPSKDCANSACKTPANTDGACQIIEGTALCACVEGATVRPPHVINF